MCNEQPYKQVNPKRLALREPNLPISTHTLIKYEHLIKRTLR